MWKVKHELTTLAVLSESLFGQSSTVMENETLLLCQM